MFFAFLIIAAYLFGSIPFGKIIGNIYGIDLQKSGSGNIGFTNSLRALGLKPALFVLLGDILKGFIPMTLALQILSLNYALAVGTIAILGHIFPVWLKFKGGKGVATGLGVTLALNPFISLSGIIIFLILFLNTKIVSISSIISAFTFCVISYFVAPKLTLFFIILTILALWTHRENINRLIKGNEKRIKL